MKARNFNFALKDFPFIGIRVRLPVRIEKWSCMWLIIWNFVQLRRRSAAAPCAAPRSVRRGARDDCWILIVCLQARCLCRLLRLPLGTTTRIFWAAARSKNVASFPSRPPVLCDHGSSSTSWLVAWSQIHAWNQTCSNEELFWGARSSSKTSNVTIPNVASQILSQPNLTECNRTLTA